jgi:hypothetical protein
MTKNQATAQVTEPILTLSAQLPVLFSFAKRVASTDSLPDIESIRGEIISFQESLAQEDEEYDDLVSDELEDAILELIVYCNQRLLGNSHSASERYLPVVLMAALNVSNLEAE